MSNVIEAFSNLWSTFWTEYHLRQTERGLISDFVRDLKRYSFWTTNDLLLCLLLALLFTVLRYALKHVISTPFVRWVKLEGESVRKFPESLWKLLYYSTLSTYCIYLCATKYPFFGDPQSVWIGWHRGMDVPLDIYIMYITQLGFYIHSFYGTAFMDDARKDTKVMYLHHALSCVLIGFSLATRFHNVGLLLLTLHDLNDVILEGCKCLLYLKVRGGKEYPIWGHLANIGFAVFSVSWFLMRVYWFFYKILYSTGYWSVRLHPSGPFYFLFNIMLWAIFFLNCWWYSFIIKAIVRIVIGKKLEDTREGTKDDTKDGGKGDSNQDTQIDSKYGSEDVVSHTEGVLHVKDVGDVQRSLEGLDLGGHNGVDDDNEDERMEVDEDVEETVRKRKVMGDDDS
ncbi:ceramide synthase 1-like [Corticium candelabrum]|uniref:ceramide synthase 1-like n=1 Tax=Corticium candelabrum TaxID=121492 RepID=UPI002E26406C|nr:ceramide synthase 1-like [Corticium candelabrum]